MKAPKAMNLYRKPIRKGQLIRLRSVPWVAPEGGEKIIEFLEKIVNKDSKILEFGSGGSTVWFAKRAKSILSFEDTLIFYQAVTEKLGRLKLKNAKVLYVPEYPRKGQRFFKKNTYDLIYLDGHRRPACCRQTMMTVKKGGYIIIPDGNNTPVIRMKSMLADARWDWIPLIEGERAAWRKPR